MTQKHLLIAFFLLFTASAAFLFSHNKSGLDPNKNADGWTVSFAAPENSEHLDFALENYSENTRFEYEVIAGKQSLMKNTLELERGKKTTINVPFSANPNTRTSVIVTAGGEKKEIYR